MGVTGSSDVFTAGTKLHGRGCLGNQITGTSTDDMYSKYTIGLFVGQYFYSTLVFTECSCTAVGAEGD